MKYQRGDSPYIKVQNKTYSYATDTWSLANADSGYPKITITDSLGVVKVNGVGMSAVITGKYEYQYQLAADAALGKWSISIQTSNGSYLDKDYDYFDVE
jgi:hypothetical protein